jgi:hypothetical protein
MMVAMNRLFLAAAVVALGACNKGPKVNVNEVSVEQAATLHQSGAVFFDANTDDYRAKNGVVPGAVLLASSSKYEVALLPEDKAKPVVFYCSNKL